MYWKAVFELQTIKVTHRGVKPFRTGESSEN